MPTGQCFNFDPQSATNNKLKISRKILNLITDWLKLRFLFINFFYR